MRMGSPDFDEEEEIPLKEETSFTSSLSSPTKGGLTHHSNRNSHAFSFETTTAAVLFCIRALRSSKADEPEISVRCSLSRRPLRLVHSLSSSLCFLN
ncbi:hypothetical protein HN51_023228 [Arachis hypogaea]